MTPSRMPRSPSPFMPAPSGADQPSTPTPIPAPAAMPATVLHAPLAGASGSAAPAHQAPPARAAAARLRALCPAPASLSVLHKRGPSKDSDELATICGRASRTTRPPGPGTGSSSGAPTDMPPRPPALRHAASTSALYRKPANEQSSASPASNAGDIAANPRRNKLIAQYQETDFWRNRDRDGLIRMKPENAGTGAADSVRRLAAAALVKYPELGYHGTVKLHANLIRQEDRSWLLEDAKTGQKTPPVDGQKYIFVTMPDGSIRVGPKSSSGIGHPQISGYAPFVKFAGEVIFEKGKEVRATTQSGTYLPPLEGARELSGLDCEFTASFENAGRAAPGLR